jgi:hypothetical protein
MPRVTKPSGAADDLRCIGAATRRAEASRRQVRLTAAWRGE